MIIYVKSQGFTKKYTSHLPGQGELEIPEGSTVDFVLRKLEVSHGLKKVIFVNGRHRPLDYPLKPRDVVVFFPPLEGG